MPKGNEFRELRIIQQTVILGTMNIFELKNEARAKMEVQLEPWAEVYYLRKGDTLKLEQASNLKGYYHIVVHDDGIQVFPGGAFDEPLVFINDLPAEPWNDFVVEAE